jgi:hypothetical protein
MQYDISLNVFKVAIRPLFSNSGLLFFYLHKKTLPENVGRVCTINWLRTR